MSLRLVVNAPRSMYRRGEARPCSTCGRVTRRWLRAEMLPDEVWVPWCARCETSGPESVQALRLVVGGVA